MSLANTNLSFQQICWNMYSQALKLSAKLLSLRKPNKTNICFLFKEIIKTIIPPKMERRFIDLFSLNEMLIKEFVSLLLI